jgi:zinc and cadmium transporter
MSLITWIILFCLLGGILSVLAAALFLVLPVRIRERALPHLISFAIGALLGAAFLALLPHAIEGAVEVDVHNITLVVLIGILTFFLLEKMVLWRHCHSSHCEVHGAEHDHAHEPSGEQAAGTLILIGDGLHNFVDGILIAAAFMTDLHLGVVTALAVAAHEIPQEVGDFAVLLNSGYSRARALIFNVLASMTTVVGGVLGYYSMQQASETVPFVLAVAASSFIYIAVADLIPGLHRRTRLQDTLKQVVLILAGVAVIYGAHTTLH